MRSKTNSTIVLFECSGCGMSISGDKDIKGIGVSVSGWSMANFEDIEGDIIVSNVKS